jgi:predicted  nucleic acid-binding Zn-ribbon protein
MALRSLCSKPQIERLEGEVEQWMVASEQLQKLGEEAVAEVSEEAESLREEVITLTQKYEEEVHRRREVEAELAQRMLRPTHLLTRRKRVLRFFFFFPTDIAESEKKLGELDAVLGRLMNIGK